MDGGAELLAEQASAALSRACGSLLGCVLVKGSAVANDGVDFIPFLSDLDLHAYLDPSGMRGPVTPTADLATAIHAELKPLSPTDFSVGELEVAFWDASDLFSWALQPLPDTYRVVVGSLPAGFRHGTNEGYMRVSTAAVDGARQAADEIIRWSAGGADLRLQARLAAKRVKPVIVGAASVSAGDPRFWAHPLAESLEQLGILAPRAADAAARFYRRLRSWSTIQHDDSVLPELIFREGIAVLDEVAIWRKDMLA